MCVAKLIKTVLLAGFLLLSAAIITAPLYAAQSGKTGLIQSRADKGDSEAQTELGKLYAAGTGGLKQDYAAAHSWWLKAANKGNAAAQNNIGALYENGHGVTQDFNEAAKWYKKAAEQGLAVAQNNLATLFEEGNGVSINYTEAFNWYSKAAEQGYAESMSNLASLYANGQGVKQNQQQAALWYQKAADKGHPYAQYVLGMFYETGAGVPLDDAKAVYWLQKAADQDLEAAQSEMAFLYLTGERGVAKNLRKAEKLLLTVAGKGSDIAMFNLGSLYEKGDLGKSDMVAALDWYLKAAEKNNYLATMKLGEIYLQGTSTMKPDYPLALKWLQQSDALGLPQAAYMLGKMYVSGIGVEKNPVKAVELFEKAAAKGSVEAMTALGQMYSVDHGIIFPHDYQKAVDWYKKAADKNDPVAQNNLGFLYARGVMNGEKDMEEAVAWYRKAGENGYPLALFNLGYHYQSGYGVEKNENEAISFYRKALASPGLDESLRKRAEAAIATLTTTNEIKPNEAAKKHTPSAVPQK